MLSRRRVQAPPEDASHTLLAELLETPPAEVRLRPVALRSVQDQRRVVLAPYPLRTWFDRALGVGERLLGIVVVVFFGWWLIDGYGRDWWHARYVAPVVAAQQTAVPLPATATAAPVKPAAHPELGVSLPVVDEPWSRPGVQLDYLAPARIYVAPPAPPAATPTPAPVAVAPPVDLRPTQLIIPALNLDSPVVEVFVQNGAWQVADYAVGYHHRTGVVGISNMVLAGHKGLRGGVFRQLEQIKPGDELIVVAAGQRYHYRVRTTGRVWPNQIDVMFPTEHAQVTLLTCTNWDTQRFTVIAEFIGPEAPAAGGN